MTFCNIPSQALPPSNGSDSRAFFELRSQYRKTLRSSALKVVSYVIAASLIISVAATSQALASFIPMQLVDLVATADFIATGEIAEVRKETFILKVNDVFAGKPGEKVEIVKFQDWPCAWRWAPYEVGQEVLVFVKREEGKLQLLGAGGESESPIVDEQVYCQFPCELKLFVFGKIGDHQVPKASLKDVNAALTEYQKCFRLTPAKKPWKRVSKQGELFSIDQIKQQCTDAELAAYARKSPVHKMLVDETQRKAALLRKPKPK